MEWPFVVLFLAFVCFVLFALFARGSRLNVFVTDRCFTQTSPARIGVQYTVVEEGFNSLIIGWIPKTFLLHYSTGTRCTVIGHMYASVSLAFSPSALSTEIDDIIAIAKTLFHLRR